MLSTVEITKAFVDLHAGKFVLSFLIRFLGQTALNRGANVFTIFLKS